MRMSYISKASDPEKDAPKSMIRFTLKCGEGHEFESWFGSSAAFETLRASGRLSCAVCGGGGVEKALMAPQVAASRDDRPAPAPAPEAPAERPLTSPVDAALRELRARIEKTAAYVGRDFAREARAIHEGEAEARAIYGEASAAEARRLVEDGVPVAPLPFPVRRDS